MTPNHLQRAARIGTPYQAVSLCYDPGDNTFTETAITRIAWACSLADRPVTAPAPVVGDLMAELFGMF